MSKTDNLIFLGGVTIFIVILLLCATAAAVRKQVENEFYNKALESCHPLALESYDPYEFTYVCADPCEHQEELCCKERRNGR